ncbi:unnamed protein product [Adineta steineri]|uniref:Uncharacterized protein n=1 Tax=Adineta steineri TaxID=433720 RepID=A0A813SVW3_9BILA|nr:unnamed protein product [Adineta steineri]CAF1334553.1 unnamed protein product [Adineta steineri]CAF1338492.1 unnamed protein product [Adineta steineri]
MTDIFDVEYPLIDPTTNLSPDDNNNNDDGNINRPFAKTKKRILIGCLIGFSVIILLIISIGIVLSRKLSTISNTTTTITVLDQSSITTTETITSSPKSCPIPSENATWNKSDVVFINQIGRCFPGEDELCNPTDLFIDDIHNTLYIADTGNNRIQKYLLTEINHSKVSSTGITAASKDLILPQSIFVNIHTEDMYILDFDQIENFQLGNSASYRVHLWKKNVKIGRILFSQAADHSLGVYYHHITLDKEMNIYVGTRYFIEKWLSLANYTEKIIVAGNSQFNSQQSTGLFWLSTFFVTNDLTIYIADWKNRRIQQWKVNATEGTTVIGNLTDVTGITMDCNGYLYFAKTYPNLIFQLNLVTNETRIIVHFEDDLKRHEFHSLNVIQIDKFGNLFFIDGGRVQKFCIVQK